MIAGMCRADMGGGFVRGVLDYVDCQAQAIGAGGYLALGAPGSTLTVVLTGLLTIFVALFGYRMLFGPAPDLRDGVIGVAKVGVVLALALSWPAYRTLIYDVAFKGPAELAGEIGRPAGLPGSTGGLVARLDLVDQGFIALGVLGIGAGQPAPVVGAPQTVAPQQVASSYDPLTLGLARAFYLVGAVGALAAMRLVAGLMLALGPFFIAFLLFDGTRGLFEGWIRVLAGSALGALGTAVVLGVELALLEPRLVELIAWRYGGYSIPGAPAELFAISLVFSLVTLAVLIASWRLTVGFGLPVAWRAAPARLAAAIAGVERRVAMEAGAAAASASVDRSRAVAVAEAVAVTQRREARAGGPDVGTAPRVAAPHGGGRGDTPDGTRPPLGQSDRRRTRGRLSSSAGRRDKGA